MTPRAFTLIELMVSVAVLGIFLSLAMVVPMTPAHESQDVVVRERARQWLEYEVDCFARGAQPDTGAVGALRALVPSGSIRRNGEVVTVGWRRPLGGLEGSMSLQVVPR